MSAKIIMFPTKKELVIGLQVDGKVIDVAVPYGYEHIRSMPIIYHFIITARDKPPMGFSREKLHWEEISPRAEATILAAIKENLV